MIEFLVFTSDRNTGHTFYDINHLCKISLNFTAVFKVDYSPLEYAYSIKESF